MFKNLTREERNWVVYDVGNSAFTLLVSTIMPIYFNSLAQSENLTSVQYLAYWGYATSIATLIVALSGPLLGTMTDNKGWKKPFFTVAVVLGCIACACLGFTTQWMLFLIIYIIAKAAYSASLIFYDSMLVDVTTEDRIDDVSSQGYAWGYIGSCIPFILSLVIYLLGPKLGFDTNLCLGTAFIITTVWWFLFTVPLLKSYQQKHYRKDTENKVNPFKQLLHTLRNATKHKKIFFFLLAFFFYIDGVYTIIDMATTYGTALGLNTVGLLLALLVTQFVAFPSAIAFGRFSKKYDSVKLISICICAYLGCAIFAFFLKSQWQFWVLAVVIGMFQGGIQALSRSYFTKIIPADQSGEYFGLMDICGKGAAFLGTIVVSLGSQITGSVNAGVGSISIFFLLGFFLFRKAAHTDN